MPSLYSDVEAFLLQVAEHISVYTCVRDVCVHMAPGVCTTQAASLLESTLGYESEMGVLISASGQAYFGILGKSFNSSGQSALICEM